MRTVAWAALAAALLSGGLSANPVYQISFTGTVTSGQVFDFNLSNNQLQNIADLAGVPVSGWLRFDLGQAPAPVVTTNSSGFVTTSIHGAGAPIFVSQYFQVGGFTVPTGFLPVPTTFNQPPFPSLPGGTTLTQTSASQILQFSTMPGGAPQAVLAGMNFGYSWAGQVSGQQITALDVLASSVQQLFPVPPAGSLPSAWGPDVTGVNGIFSFAEFFQDHAVQANFGVTTDYSVQGNFALESISGGNVVATREPSTWLPTMAGLLACALCFRRRRIGRPVR